ncbi:hypothetical protein PLICRDRAFT_37986 [Plicaturopsis crispa FD-325 SS-3]|nr:hypothetical protein PLICRDRAFT_37986 [Plicaturopsis crispa FD-325 SS-3]
MHIPHCIAFDMSAHGFIHMTHKCRVPSYAFLSSLATFDLTVCIHLPPPHLSPVL